MSETQPATPVVPAVAAAPAQVRRSAGPDKAGFYWGTGRRKTAVARVRIKAGTGKFLVNNRESTAYFSEVRDREDITIALKLTKTLGNVDVYCNVNGGGITGQAGAIKLGVARALRGYDSTLEPILRDNDLLTRDSRAVERKKYGQSGARRRFQFSKR